MSELIEHSVIVFYGIHSDNWMNILNYKLLPKLKNNNITEIRLALKNTQYNY